MRRIAGLTLLIGAFLDARVANACSCLPAQSACAAYWQADAMFAGTVVDIQPAPSGAPERLAVRFTVDQPGRGTVGNSAVIYATPQDGINCGYTFRVGERYVVRAHSATGGSLTTSMCSGTRRVSEAPEDIAFLKQVTGTPRGGRVFGQVRLVENPSLAPEDFDRGPVSGARLRLFNDVASRETVTATDGVYDFDNLPFGEYRLSFAPPPGVGLPGPPLPPDERVSPGPWMVTVSNPSECVERPFRVQSTAQLTGRLLAPDGSPAADHRVDLVAVSQANRVEQTIPHVSAWTNADGRYTFAFIAQGQYVVGINLADPPAYTRIDRRVYYPGVSALEDATIVTVSEPGARVELQPFRVPAPPTERIVEGIVLWPDGRPAAGARITLHGATSEGVTTPDGRFRYVLPYGARYSITVAINTPNGETAYSIPTTIDRDDRGSRIEIRLRTP
jgi:hypothetical protein